MEKKKMLPSVDQMGTAKHQQSPMLFFPSVFFTWLKKKKLKVMY